MKRRSKFAAATIMIVMVISLSLNIVFAINQSAIPGSEQDPIVSKSYVDAAELTVIKSADTFDELSTAK